MRSGSQGNVLTRIEHSLACHRPFGDYCYLNERMWLHYDRRLEMLSEHIPMAAVTLAASRRASLLGRYYVLGDPVVRSTIDAALAYFKLRGPDVSIEETKAVLKIAARHLLEGRRLEPLAVGAPYVMRLGKAWYHAWVWCDEREEDVSVRNFRRLFNAHLTSSARLSLKTPNEDDKRMLVKGARLLDELLPKLARSALSHAHLVAVVTSPLGITSVTNPAIPGAAFFSPLVLKNPWRAAEFLLHEALHLKFIDLEHTHSMLRRGFTAEGSPRIRAVWNRSQSDDSNEWPANRVLTVLHVYTSLALFFKTMELRLPEIGERYGSLYDLKPDVAARRALDRAYYLALNVKDLSQELGLAGQRFTGWLLELLKALDPEPRSARSNAHLLLDLYERETEQITRVIAGASPLSLRSKDGHSSASPQKIIGDLVQSELASTDCLLSDMCGGVSFVGIDDEYQVLSIAKDKAAPAEIAAKFCSVRSLISRSLRKAIARAHEAVLQTDYLMRVEQHVGAMLEHSGPCINALNQMVGHRDPD